MAADHEGGGSGTVMREYRKGNWTVSETMVLIEAKQMDDERRLMKRSNSTGESYESSSRSNKPAELRWKWVEDYCWRKGCLRSQNQCNDKWDNLMRDYKKVRDFERKFSSSSATLSYWKMEKNERKENNLPNNMLIQIYEALVEVVDKNVSGQRVIAGAGGGSAGSGSNPNIGFVMERSPMMSMVQLQPVAVTASFPPMALQQQHHHQVLSAAIPMLPLPQPLPLSSLQPLQSAGPTVDNICGSSDSETSGYSADSPAKKRRRQGGGGNVRAATASASTSQEIGTAIVKSASIIAEALHACEEREERRHKDLVSLHEKRLKIEESKSEINRQEINNGLIVAINKLANSILALASSSSSSNNNNNQQSAPK